MCKQESKNNFLNILQSKQKWSESRILQIIGGRNLQLVRCLCLHHHFTVFKYLNRCCDIFFLGLSGFCHFFKFKKMVGIKYRISSPVAVFHTASPLYRHRLERRWRSEGVITVTSDTLCSQGWAAGRRNHSRLESHQTAVMQWHPPGHGLRWLTSLRCDSLQWFLVALKSGSCCSLRRLPYR